MVFTSSPLMLDRAERVVFVPDGHVAAVGTHHELLHSNAQYRAVVTREGRTSHHPSRLGGYGIRPKRGGSHDRNQDVLLRFEKRLRPRAGNGGSSHVGCS